jgi:hypothetical protein
MVFVLSLLTQTIKLFDTVIAIVTSDPSRHEVMKVQNGSMKRNRGTPRPLIEKV